MTQPQLRLHNTLTRAEEAFEPTDPSCVRLYVCGPTVYQRIHVGNARPLVVFDVLYRLLRHLHSERHVTYVRNITDIDDKIIAQAAANGETIGELTERTIRQFQEDAASLGCLPPTHEPRATEHVPGMVALIGELVGRGHAYAAEGHVLFHVPSMPAYGRLSGRDRADQIAGARVEVAPYKRDPADFVLWKPSDPAQPGWDSPWGRGRPGWHVECSAMSEALLGPLPFDIHGGGLDLIFPHHENEIAQSCCARDVERMARVWLHNGFVDMRGEKMAKSVGNVVRVDEALARVPGEALRLHLLGTHYRQPVNFTAEGLIEAKRTLDRFYRTLEMLEGVEPMEVLIKGGNIEFDLLDDLNTPEAIASLHSAVNDANIASTDEEKARARAEIMAAGELLGILQWSPDDWFRGSTAGLPLVTIKSMIVMRSLARANKDFVRADSIRKGLERQGVVLEDTPSGTKWRRA